MRARLSIFVGLFLAFYTSQAIAMLMTQQFTSVEGFVAGDLAGQQDWMTSHSGIFTVDPTGEGKVTAVGTWRQAWHSGAGIQLGVGESITMRTVFQLTGEDLATPPTGGVNMMRTGLYMYDTDTEAWTTFN